MMLGELKPGNPLRVRCRTCKAMPGFPCAFPPGQKPARREFHGKRCRDAHQDFITYGKPLIVGTRQSQTERRIRGSLRAEAWRKTKAQEARRIASLGEVKGAERTLSDLSRSALDMNTPAFWNAVWSKRGEK